MSRRNGMRRVGLISDTHGLLRPQATQALRGSDVIVHAGDIGSAEIIAKLEAIAPVVAIRGNNDMAAWAVGLPERLVAEYGAAKIYVLHDRNELTGYPAPAGCNVIVTGHSHRPHVERRGGVLYVNPGSAGPRRFKLPISVALLHLRAGLEAEIIELEVY